MIGGLLKIKCKNKKSANNLKYLFEFILKPEEMIYFEILLSC